jgi:hypothetical protein
MTIVLTTWLASAMNRTGKDFGSILSSAYDNSHDFISSMEFWRRSKNNVSVGEKINKTCQALSVAVLSSQAWLAVQLAVPPQKLDRLRSQRQNCRHWMMFCQIAFSDEGLRRQRPRS